jgi:hypothetical protein
MISVTRASSTDIYIYDENGNPSTGSGRCMTCRVEAGEIFNQIYNAETCTEPVEVTASPASPKWTATACPGARPVRVSPFSNPCIIT